MHIELTEMLRCPQPHREEFLVLSTGEISGRRVRSGLVGCPVCHREYRIVDGVVDFGGSGERGAVRESATESTAPRSPLPDAQTLQALLDLSGPGGYVVLLGGAARAAPGLAALMGGIHFVGINAPPGLKESPELSLLRGTSIPLRHSMARGVVVGAESVEPHWLAEAVRVLLRGRRLVTIGEDVEPAGVTRLAAGQGVWVGERQG